MFIKTVSLVTTLLWSATTVLAQDNFCKVWYTEEKTSKVEIYLAADGTYAGKIVWLRDGIVNGQPLIDKKNPDETQRKKTWLGLQIIKGLVKKSETEIVGGKIYDPTHGNYYNCKMTLKGTNVLELRGYILGMPFLGKTTTWYLAEPAEQPARKNTPAPAGTPLKEEKNL